MKQKSPLITSLMAGVLTMGMWSTGYANEQAVLSHYADLAHTMYQDALSTAKQLQVAIKQLVDKPTEKKLVNAREAWKLARVPYQQTEAYRFGNGIVDDWEGKVNAWPLDEGLIDYVGKSYGADSDENLYYSANVIANKKLVLSGKIIDATHITKALLAETLHEVDEVESNVATGYHAIEFLLWGQDNNGSGPGAGNRPASDYDTQKCTMGNCGRRGEYLVAVTELLVDELEWMTAQWNSAGDARKAVLEADTKQSLTTIFTGMGSLAYGELAGERMKLGVMLHDPEEEHDCFSDNTHWSHYYDAKSIKNVYTGSYTRVDGSVVKGPSVSDLVAAKDAELDKAIRDRLSATEAKMQVLVDSAEKEGIAYDQLLAEGNAVGNAKIMAAVTALLEETKAIEKAVELLKLQSVAFEGSDSLDAPGKVN